MNHIKYFEILSNLISCLKVILLCLEMEYYFNHMAAAAGLILPHSTIDVIKRLWHELYGKLHRPGETWSRYITIGYEGALYVSIDGMFATALFLKKFRSIHSTKQSLVLSLLVFVRPYMGFPNMYVWWVQIWQIWLLTYQDENELHL